MVSSRIPKQQIGFRAFMRKLADRVGLQHLPLRDDAVDINELVAADAVHHELVKRVIRTMYCANRCGHLDAGVSTIPTFSALGTIRGQLANCPATDVDQIKLLDEIGWAARQILQAAEPISPFDLHYASSDQTDVDRLTEWLVPMRRPQSTRQ